MSRYPSYRTATLLSVGSALCLACVTVPAAAAPCYEVLDRADAIVYQGPLPPVDLSSAGDAARDALRKRGEVLINFDTSTCPLRKPSPSTGKSEASVDEIVSGIRSYSVPTRNNDSGPSISGNAPTSTANAPVNIGIGY
jgi:hypothetical protein